jgi:hypothetical protein
MSKLFPPLQVGGLLCLDKPFVTPPLDEVIRVLNRDASRIESLYVLDDFKHTVGHQD